MAVQHRCWPSIQCRPGSAVRAARVLAVVCLLAVRTRVGGSAPRGGGGAEDGAEGDAEGSDGRPAVVVKLANALHRSTEYGQYDDEFLKSNIAEVLRAGREHAAGMARAARVASVLAGANSPSTVRLARRVPAVPACCGTGACGILPGVLFAKGIHGAPRAGHDHARG